MSNPIPAQVQSEIVTFTQAAWDFARHMLSYGIEFAITYVARLLKEWVFETFPEFADTFAARTVAVQNIPPYAQH